MGSDFVIPLFKRKQKAINDEVSVYQESLTLLESELKLNSSLLKSRDYYRFDTNADGRITISDTYSIYAKRNNLFTSFSATPPDSRIFTSAQWTTISNNSSNLKISHPGVQSVTINTPASGGVSTYYITRVGYAN